MNAQADNIRREVEFCDHLIERLDERIQNGEPTAISAALRVQAQRIRIIGLAGGEAGAAASYDWSRLSDSELETLRDLLKKAIGAAPKKSEAFRSAADTRPVQL